MLGRLPALAHIRPAPWGREAPRFTRMKTAEGGVVHFSFMSR